jgi:hypothetical protein
MASCPNLQPRKRRCLGKKFREPNIWTRTCHLTANMAVTNATWGHKCEGHASARARPRCLVKMQIFSQDDPGAEPVVAITVGPRLGWGHPNGIINCRTQLICGRYMFIMYYLYYYIIIFISYLYYYLYYYVLLLCIYVVDICIIMYYSYYIIHIIFISYLYYYLYYIIMYYYVFMW